MMRKLWPLRMVGAALPTLLLCLACGNSKKEDSEANGIVVNEPCSNELAGLCGEDCSNDDNCETGQHCASSACTAVCTQEGAQCVGTCDDRGRCDGMLVTVLSGSPPAGEEQDLIGEGETPAGTGGGTDACIEVVSGFESVIPTVLLLIDRSGSMGEPFDGDKDRWNTVRDTLTDPTNGLIRRLERYVRFGLTLYSSENPGDDSTEFDVCPNLVNVDIALANYESIRSVFAEAQTLIHTPTAESIEAAAELLLNFQATGPKAIILATDGDPDTCQDGDDHSQSSMDNVVETVREAYADNIQTYVISVGEDVTREHLEEVAQTGQNDPNALPYPALSTQELENAFSEIIGGVRGCAFKLNGSVPAEHAPNGTVTLGNATLTFGDPNGWFMPDDKTVELQGSACELLKTSSDIVNISFPCIPEADIAK